MQSCPDSLFFAFFYADAKNAGSLQEVLQCDKRICAHINFHHFLLLSFSDLDLDKQLERASSDKRCARLESRSGDQTSNTIDI